MKKDYTYFKNTGIEGRHRSPTLCDWLIWIGCAFIALILGAILFYLLLVPHEAKGDTVVIAPTDHIVEANKMVERGESSWYIYNIGSWSSENAMVAASRTFKRGSLVVVTNEDNGKSVVVKITDFGPCAKVFPDRVIDLSPAAFEVIEPAGRVAGLIHNVSVQELN